MRAHFHSRARTRPTLRCAVQLTVRNPCAAPFQLVIRYAHRGVEETTGAARHVLVGLLPLGYPRILQVFRAARRRLEFPRKKAVGNVVHEQENYEEG